MTKDFTIMQIEVMFKGLHNRGSAKSLPKPETLSKKLTQLVNGTKNDTVPIDLPTLSCFASAAVEMWHRSVHSFLVSASLTKASTLWSSVSGYYSSHYVVRAFAHLLGYFQLHSKKRIIKVEVSGNQYLCNIQKKQGSDREHKFYWKTVKNNTKFSNDPFFTKNEDVKDCSDISHRNKANYADHINQFPRFRVLDEVYLKNRVDKISGMPLSYAPIPRSYPDLDNVQVIAYYRMVKFKVFVDEILGGKNRFWNINRKPEWCPDFLDFQIAQQENLSIYKEQ